MKLLTPNDVAEMMHCSRPIAMKHMRAAGALRQGTDYRITAERFGLWRDNGGVDAAREMLSALHVSERIGCSVFLATMLVAEVNGLAYTVPSDEPSMPEAAFRRWMAKDLSRKFRERREWRDGAYYVYFVESDSGPVKIGFTSSVIKRVDAIQTGCPHAVRLRAVLPGGKQLEAALHARFHALHLRGEWFRNEGEIAKLLERAPK